MEDRSAVIKVLLFLTVPLRPSSAVTHTLEYSYTMVTLGSRFTSVALLDGEEFMYYDSNTANMTPNTEWIKKVEQNSSFWEKETRSVKFQRDWLIDKLNQTKGGDTLQRVYGCVIDDKNVTRGYDKSIYNGKDFISLDLNTGTWTAVDERAKSFTENWNPVNNNAAYWKNFLNRTCVDRLESYIPHSTKKEEPGGAEETSDVVTEGGSDERKTAVTVVVVLVLVLVLVLVAAAVVGFVIYKTKLCAYLRSGYVAARQSAEQ